MDWTLEVVVVPVGDLEASIAFYRDKVGFALDHDTRTDQMHLAQLTPRGSGCSIVMGDLPSLRAMAPGSLHGLHPTWPGGPPRRGRGNLSGQRSTWSPRSASSSRCWRRSRTSSGV